MLKSPDVIIIGAGAAGLAAARALCAAHQEVLVLEARQRIGGRVFTVHNGNSVLPVELGAEFVHGDSPEAFEILDAARITAVELPDLHWRANEGSLRPLGDYWSRIDQVRKRIRKTTRDRSFAQFLESQKSLSSDLRALARAFVEGYHSAHLDRISTQSLAMTDDEVEGSADNKQFRLLGGYDGLMNWLAAGLEPGQCAVQLNTVAEAIEWKKGKVRVRARCAGERVQFDSRAVIVTIPLGVLKAPPDAQGALRIDPYPDTLRSSLSQLEMGSVFKIIFEFRERFWDKDDFLEQRLAPARQHSSLNFLHAPDSDVPTWWTSAPARLARLTGWAGGPKAESMLGQPESVSVERSLRSLSTMLGMDQSELRKLTVAWTTHDWSADPFSRGAYSYVGVGGVKAQKALARPIEGTLFFAGEATESEQTGTVIGAIESGRRAARQLTAG